MKKMLINAIMIALGKETLYKTGKQYEIMFAQEVFELEQMLVYVENSIRALLGDMDQNFVGQRADEEFPNKHIYGARMRYALSMQEMLRNDLMMRLEQAKRNSAYNCQSVVGPV